MFYCNLCQEWCDEEFDGINEKEGKWICDDCCKSLEPVNENNVK